MRDSRERCLLAIAAALGCDMDALPRELQRAVMLHGHECHQIALAHSDDERHDRTTAPAPSRTQAGVYRDVPTRVDRVRSLEKKTR